MEATKDHKEEIQYILRRISLLDLQQCKTLARWLSEYISLLDDQNELCQKSIQYLNLTTRAQKVLRSNNIFTIGSLIQKASNWDNIRVLKGAGAKVLTELDHKIKQIQKGEIEMYQTSPTR